MDSFDAFGNDIQVLSFGPDNGLILENSQEVVVMYGNVELMLNQETIDGINDIIKNLEIVKNQINEKLNKTNSGV